ncbi:hypothetical protein [Erythrobacter sp. F6033]|uniref:hypothetical protein n=1 Tax=Erythrobacter sp. F6033 TaxID=2926401 RepID=UPI001FF5DEA2|nr:hypothetical protein [Erythrobacter sp. F6033]MCK0129250.1 hypothetical protein [Erythrobacter sp. F6033]
MTNEYIKEQSSIAARIRRTMGAKCTKSIGLACALTLGMSISVDAPAFAQSDVQRMNELARPHGAPGGTYTVITVPPDADIIGVRVYADENSRDRQIYGIKLRYQDPATGEATWTATMGSAAGKTFEFTPRADERVNRINLWTRRNGALAGVQLGTNVQGYGVFSRNFDGRRTIDIGRNREFGGLTARTDGQVLLGLGIIGFDPSNPSANTAWASNPPRSTSQQGAQGEPRAPWETNPPPRVAADDRDPRPRTSTNTPTSTGGNTGQTPSPRVPAAQPPTSRPPTVASAPPASTPPTSTPPTTTPADWKPDFDESVEAFGLHRFENRWKPDQRIDTPNGTRVITRVAPDGYWGAQWVLEPVEMCCFRIRNRWTETYLVNSNGSGPVTLSGDIEENDRRAIWKIEGVENEPFLRFINLYNDATLHIENSSLVAGGASKGWLSAQWSVKKLDGTDVLDGASEPPQTTTPVPQTSTPPVPATKPPAILTLFQNSALSVHYKVNFQEPGKLWARAAEEKMVLLGQKRQVVIPHAARNSVRVIVYVESLPKGSVVFDEVISLDNGRCILTTGTVFSNETRQTNLGQC